MRSIRNAKTSGIILSHDATILPSCSRVKYPTGNGWKIIIYENIFHSIIAKQIE